MQRYLFSVYMTSYEISFYHTISNCNVWNATLFGFRVHDAIFRVTFSPYFFYKSSILSQNLFLLSILQHFIASKTNHINTMLPNEMVLAPLQKLKIKYELSYQSNTKLKYIDKFDQLLIIHQLTCTVDNTVRSLIHFTIFI